MGMRTDIVARWKLTRDERAGMFSLFDRYYDNVEAVRFEADLAAKDWVILLRNRDDDLVGFSTLQVYGHTGASGPVTILYSGDTIIERTYRRSGDLAGAFGHFLLRAIRDHAGTPVYWLLTSKGVRTYRFLPVFFKTSFPVFDRETPVAIKQLVDALAAEKFGDHYSASRQVVSHGGERDRLCESEHDPVLLGRPDPHIAFFLECNPGYVNGDELVCISPMTEENLNAKARRVIERTEVCWRE